MTPEAVTGFGGDLTVIASKFVMYIPCLLNFIHAWFIYAINIPFQF